MKNLIAVLFTLAIFNTSCKKEENSSGPTGPIPHSASTIKIMHLGASRVEGNRPDYESYRYELWKMLVDGNHDFDYIGTMEDDGNYPSYKNYSFDTEHEGRGGWTSGEILSGLPGWLSQTGSPDIVLFSSPGGNDGLQGLSYSNAVTNINSIIDILQANNPNITIIIEQMAPAHSTAMTSELSTFLTQIQQDVVSIATNQSDSLSTVTSIDMYTGFSDSYLADDVHYNESGANFIASKYYTILENLIP